MSHSSSVVVNGDNSQVTKSAQSTMAFTSNNNNNSITNNNNNNNNNTSTMLPSSTNIAPSSSLTIPTTVQTSSATVQQQQQQPPPASDQFVSGFKPSRSNLCLNFGQAGESAKKRIKIENYLQETPELAKLFTDVPANKYFSPLQTPDLAKIGISTPELDRIALRFSGQATVAPLATPMTIANILEDPALNVLANSSSTAAVAAAAAAAVVNTAVSQNQVTVINAPLNPITMIQSTIDENDDIKCGRKRYRSTTIDEQTRQHANSLLMLSSHSEHSVSSTDSHPTEQILPIDMDNQERIKIDRKRERNRIAASRCRQRKLERISTLQDKVREFEEKNDKLTKYIEFLEELIQRRENAFCTHQRFNCEH